MHRRAMCKHWVHRGVTLKRVHRGVNVRGCVCVLGEGVLG
jgi:hypothetical protein